MTDLFTTHLWSSRICFKNFVERDARYLIGYPPIAEQKLAMLTSYIENAIANFSLIVGEIGAPDADRYAFLVDDKDNAIKQYRIIFSKVIKEWIMACFESEDKTMIGKFKTTKLFSELPRGRRFIEVLTSSNEIATKVKKITTQGKTLTAQRDNGKMIFVDDWEPVFIEGTL